MGRTATNQEINQADDTIDGDSFEMPWRVGKYYKTDKLFRYL